MNCEPFIDWCHQPVRALYKLKVTIFNTNIKQKMQYSENGEKRGGEYTHSIEYWEKAKRTKSKKLFNMKLKNYWSPTPKKLKKLGDTFLALAIYGEVHSTTIDPMTGHILVYVGIAGKFLTNFFSDDEPVTPAQ